MGPLMNLTLITGLTDSLNPIGIAQQFALQGLIKKNYHIWYYITSVFVTNFLAGIILYVGMATLSDNILKQYWDVLEKPIGIIAIIIAVFLAWKSIQSIIVGWRQRKLLVNNSNEEEKSLEKNLANKEISPKSLIGIGFITTIMELTTAAPYFAYLILIQQYNLSIWSFLTILIFYNILYSLPFIVLYFLSVFLKDAFQAIYQRINVVLQLLSTFLVPAILVVIAMLALMFGLNVF